MDYKKPVAKETAGKIWEWDCRQANDVAPSKVSLEKINPNWLDSADCQLSTCTRSWALFTGSYLSNHSCTCHKSHRRAMKDDRKLGGKLCWMTKVRIKHSLFSWAEVFISGHTMAMLEGRLDHVNIVIDNIEHVKRTLIPEGWIRKDQHLKEW